MVDYARIAATTQRLVGKFADGRKVRLVKRQRAPADPTKPWRGPVDEDATPHDPGEESEWDAGGSEWDAGSSDWDDEAEPSVKYSVEVPAVFEDRQLIDIFASERAVDTGRGLGFLVRRSGQSFLIAALDVSPFVPEDFDDVVDGNEVHKIEEVETVRPGSTPLLYRFVLSR